MDPIKGEWTRFVDFQDQLSHYRQWGLIPEKSKKLRPVMFTDGYFGTPEPCHVVGYQTDKCAVIEIADGLLVVRGEYLAELQPAAQQKLPYGVCFVDILSKYIVVDIETTGFDFHNDRIIEIAAVSYEYGQKISEYHTLVNPGMLLPPDIVSLTWITQADVDGAPFLDEITPDFLSYIGSTPLIGHNAVTFDIPFLRVQMAVDLPNAVIDTLPLARSAFPMLPRHKLQYLNDTLNLGSAGAHRALHDVETTNTLLWACLAPRRYEEFVYKFYLYGKTGHVSTKPKPAQTKPSPIIPVQAKASTVMPVKKEFHRIDIKTILPSCGCTDSSSPLCGKNIVFTGELAIPREEAMQIAVDSGAILKTSVSRKTDYLVVGTQDITVVGMDGMSTKEEKAHALNDSGKAHIQIIHEEEFLKLAKKEENAV